MAQFSLSQNKAILLNKYSYKNNPFGKYFFILEKDKKGLKSFNIVKKLKLKEFCFLKYNFEPAQEHLQQYLAGDMDRIEYLNYFSFYKLDSSSFSKLKINQDVNLLVGIDSGNNKKLIFDQNNNDDLNDDSVFIFDSIIRKKDGFVEIRNIEIYYKSRLYKQNLFLRPTSILYDDMLLYKNDTLCNLMIELGNFGMGEFKNRSGYWKIASLIKPSDYNFGRTNSRTLLFTNTDTFQDVSNGYQPYSINDTIALGSQFYILDSLSTFGDSLFMREVKRNKILYGGNLNDFGLPFSGMNVKNRKRISLANNFKSKYIMLEFWGTWCGPCKEIMPQLREFYANVNKKKIEFLGVAFRSENDDVLNYINDNKILWPQIIDKLPLSTIVKSYKVSAYPTYILLNENRKIIFRSVGIEGFQKMKEFILKLSID